MTNRSNVSMFHIMCLAAIFVIVNDEVKQSNSDIFISDNDSVQKIKRAVGDSMRKNLPGNERDEIT